VLRASEIARKRLALEGKNLSGVQTDEDYHANQPDSPKLQKQWPPGLFPIESRIDQLNDWKKRHATQEEVRPKRQDNDPQR
jgi:hypothetical protein